MTEFYCPIETAAEIEPDAPAIVAPGGVLSFRECHRRTSAIRDRLHALGIRRGDVLAMAVYPDPEYLLTMMALFRAGAVACPLNPRWPANALFKAMASIGCAKVLMPARMKIDGITVFSAEDLLPRAAAESQARTAGTSERPRSRTATPPATVVFTSGSTGEPKAAVHSFTNHYCNALASNRNIVVGPGTRWLLSLPMCHVAGIGVLFRCMVGCGTVVLPKLGEPLEDSIERDAITHVSLVSTQLHRMLASNRGRDALKRLKAILLGGSAIPRALIKNAHKHGLPIYTSYGLTEMASQVTTTRPGDPVQKLLTSGCALDADTIRVAGDGEIQVRGKTLFLGYREGSVLKRPLTQDGWFATGDLGSFDADGYLSVTGRKDNMFVSGGENIQPEEIERLLCRQPNVINAVVVPVLDREFGHVGVAFVQLASGAKLNPDDLSARLSSELPRYKVPKRFHPWPSRMERPDSKVSRIALAALAESLR